MFKQLEKIDIPKGEGVLYFKVADDPSPGWGLRRNTAE